MGAIPLTGEKLKKRFEREMNPPLGLYLVEAEGLSPREVEAYTNDEAFDLVFNSLPNASGLNKRRSRSDFNVTRLRDV